LPNDELKCTTTCQHHQDTKDILEKHEKIIYGDADKDGILTKMSSLMIVKVMVYSFIATVMASFIGSLIALVWKGAK
jgi:hypothetical protein